MSYSANYSGATAKNLNGNFNTVKKKGSFSIGKGILYIFLSLLAVVCALPFYFMIINSTHSSADIAQKFLLLPGLDFLDNYNRMIKLVPIWTGFFNSLVIATCATVLSGYFGALTSFGFAKYKFKGKEFLFAIVLASLIVPQQIALVGFYKVVSSIHLMNNRAALVIPAIASASVVFFVRYYIQSAVSDSVMESARMDGCGEFRIFNSIILPMIVPSLATMSIFTFIGSWNSYLLPLFILSDQNKYTVPLMTALSKGVYQNDYGAVYACIAISMMPIIVVFSFCSK
ncbi:MAG: carbohydrate ABC transporter permease [Bacillota bacterium]|nr:carbohydrate ABC transporter permease [Bacillota bacterium]